VVEVLGERVTTQVVFAGPTQVLIDGHVIGALYPPERGSLLKRVCTIDLASSHLSPCLRMRSCASPAMCSLHAPPTSRLTLTLALAGLGLYGVNGRGGNVGGPRGRPGPRSRQIRQAP
jgi:hypothetical protein